MWFRPFDDAGPNGAPRAETLGTFSLDVRIRIVRGGAVDLYALVGTGLAWTRPVSIIDPSHRRFSYEAALGYQAGIGARVLVAPRASLFVEARDWLHFQKDENRVVGLDPDDRSSWYGGSRLVNQVEVHVGVAMLLPVL